MYQEVVLINKFIKHMQFILRKTQARNGCFSYCEIQRQIFVLSVYV